MDLLDKKKQEKIRKMSDTRLNCMLSRAGVDPDEVEVMDRPKMIDAWAKLVAVTFDRLAFEREKFEYKKSEWERLVLIANGSGPNHK